MKGIVILVALGLTSALPVLFLDWGWIFPVLALVGIVRVLYQALYLASEDKKDMAVGLEPYRDPDLKLANSLKDLLS
jgi:hypothetical protein